jgi:hypothetical protein
MKQISKQSVYINIGDKAAPKKKRAARKRPARSAKGSGLIGGFVAPIINYPPNYVNPSVLQPLQQTESLRVPAAAAARAPAPAVFNEGENLLGLPVNDPTRLNVQQADPAVPVAPFVAEQPETTPFAPEPPKPAKERRKKDKEPENTLGGLDTNLGSAFEPNLPRSVSLRSEELPGTQRRRTGRPQKYFSEEERRSARAAKRTKEAENTLGGLDTNLGSAFEPNLQETVSLTGEELSGSERKRTGRPQKYFSEEERRAARAEKRALKQSQLPEQPPSLREAYESSFSFIGEPKAQEAPPGLERKREK